MSTEVWLGIIIPFVGTSLGAALVFVLRKSFSENLQKVLTGFAAGAMVAASFWSLLQPALESSENMSPLSFLPAAVGFFDRYRVSSVSGSCYSTHAYGSTR